MKLTLAFDVYNKAEWIADLLHSWLGNLSGRHGVEAIVVFDASRDDSPAIAREVLAQYDVAHAFLYADDIYEIRCNNMALAQADGDVIVFVQDDNWMHDRSYDETLLQVLERTPDVGAVGLLAGLQLMPGLRWRRIEVDRPHKGEQFAGAQGQPLAVYAVDAINRPFAIRVELLRSLGGLDETYCPTSYDDLDLSIELLKAGYTNLYVPFDLLNTGASKDSMGEQSIQRHYGRGHELCRRRHRAYVDRMESTVRPLYPLQEREGRLALCAT